MRPMWRMTAVAALLALALLYHATRDAYAQASSADQRRAERLATLRAQGMRAVFDQPVLELRETGGRSVLVTPGAIVARERYQVHAVRMVLAADVNVGAPFNLHFPARMLLLTRTGDPARAHCLLPNPEPRDESGRVYPDVCLLDRDGDGRFEIARFQAEDPGDPARNIAIAPVALRRLPPGPQPGLISIAAEQRLRIARVGRDGVMVVTESRLVPAGAADAPWATRRNVVGVLGEVDGATVQVAGLQLTAHRDTTGALTIATSGEFSPWLTLREDNAVIDTGAATMGAH